MSEKDLDLGLLTKAAIIDRAIADAAFALKEGAVSEPIKGTFGTVLIKVVKIEPEQVKKFEEVAAEIKQTLAAERARSEIADPPRQDRGRARRRGCASPRSRRSSASRPARSRRSTARAAIRTASRSPAGPPASIRSARVRRRCRRRQRAAADPGRRLRLVRGDGITPARERTLDEVAPQVEERWRNDEISKRLQAKATEMVDKLKAGAPFADVAAPRA